MDGEVLKINGTGNSREGGATDTMLDCDFIHGDSVTTRADRATTRADSVTTRAASVAYEQLQAVPCLMRPHLG